MQLIIDLIKYQGHLPISNGLNGFIYFFSQIIAILFVLLYFHQFIFLFLGSLKQSKIKPKVFNLHSYGIIIAARNESKVIGNLIKSIKACDYPQDLIKIFVVADNCTDNTAQICRDLGCVVVERFNKGKVGKGYALNYLFTKLHTEPEYADIVPESYIVLDADNVVKSDYITEMNKVYDSGYEIVTSYRNSKNFGKNWISSGYGFWFMHESRHLNNSRMLINSCCAISGTGFLISAKVVKEYDNWKFFTLTEDIQCSTEYALSGRKVGYAGNAEFYDEQPETFKQAWNQRVRWARGYYQVYGLRGWQLIKGSFKNFACWDILTSIFPAMVLTLLTIVVLPVCSIVGLCMGDFANALFAFTSLLNSFVSLYFVVLLIGILICITEWKKILCPGWKKILYLFTFPFYMLTYVPISIRALFGKVGWKPIVHTADVSIESLQNKSKK